MTSSAPPLETPASTTRTPRSTPDLAATAGPWVGVLGLGTWAVVRPVRWRRAWWTALAAAVSAPGLWSSGGALAGLAAGGASA